MGRNWMCLLISALVCGFAASSAGAKTIAQNCVGKLIRDDIEIHLEPLKKGATFDIWCDAGLFNTNDKGMEAFKVAHDKVLSVCRLGDICEIKGVVEGYGSFSWYKIHSVRRVQ
jgi:hypothetical protein